MNLPKHIEKITNPQRRAVAPYNFVELPDQVVPAENLPDGDRYYLDRHTGRIECTLITESPLYTRCGRTPEQFKEEKEAKEFPEFFYLDPDTKTPVLPGSILRGMLRTLVEIASFSKIEQVSDAQKFFFRAVAADSDDPLRDEYKRNLGNQGKKVRAGYLCKQGNHWFIRPALSIENNSFVWIKEKIAKSAINKLILMEDVHNYRPQYFQNISFGEIVTKNGRKFAKKISKNSQDYKYIGVLVTAGNMLEGASEGTTCNRKNHYLIREPDFQANLIPINDDAIKDYLDALTPFQKEQPFNEQTGMLKNGRAIFYVKHNNEVTLFGQSPNFRIPYIPQGKTKTASAINFIPDNLKNIQTIDLAEAIFGWVRPEKQKENQSRAGRVFVGDGKYKKDENGLWYEDNPITPQILASPKPTTFQHYLVQTDVDKKNLKHYASKPNEETVIRGHKLYWHKGSNLDIKHPEPNNASDSRTTQIKPIKKGVTFTFDIHFENLTDVELGALLWVLDKAKGDYRLKLGMGKPLGMGAVKIESQLYLSDRTKRYTQLFDHNNWEIAETPILSNDYINIFEKYILKHISEDDLPLPETKTKQDIKQLDEIPRIKMLLAMLTWTSHPNSGQTKYMELEDFKDRKVLPTPLQVMDWEDNRRPKNSLKVDTSDGSQQIKPKPTLKGDQSKKSYKSQQDSNPDKPKWRR